MKAEKKNVSLHTCKNVVRMLRVLIVDDELGARRALQKNIEENCPELEIVATAANVPEAVRAIGLHSPDIVFLDIEMAGYNGFQLFDFFEKITFDVVFVTAYNQYAVRAFETAAIDYLLKPVSADRLLRAMEKIIQLRHSDTLQARRNYFQTYIENERKQRLSIETKEGVIWINTQDLVRIEADGAYSVLYLQNGKKHTVSKNIGDYEERLTHHSKTFFRAHRSHLININYVETVQNNGDIILLDGSSIPIARTRKSELIELLKNDI